MSPRAEKYHLLNKGDPIGADNSDAQSLLSDTDVGSPRFIKRTTRRNWRKRDILLTTSSSLNLIFLVVCLALLAKIYNRPVAVPSADGLTPYAKLGRDPGMKWPYNTGYGADVTNHTLLDERWEAISIDDGVVAIDKQWAYEHNLGESQPFPWDDTKGIYLITAFHALHCVMTVHRLVYELHHNLPRTRSTDHALHCLDHLRTDAMCEADDFLLPSGPPRYMSHGPRGQARVCRNWDQLVAWARQRNACYHHISNDEERFGAEHSQFERFMYCPEDSPYYEKMMEFKKDNAF